MGIRGGLLEHPFRRFFQKRRGGGVLGAPLFPIEKKNVKIFSLRGKEGRGVLEETLLITIQIPVLNRCEAQKFFGVRKSLR